MVEELRSQLDEHQSYINGELSELLTQVFNDVADQFESLRLDLQSLRNLQNKYVESDVSVLQSEVASLRADLSSLQSIVGNLAFQVGQLADTVSAIERSGAGKIVGIAGQRMIVEEDEFKRELRRAYQEGVTESRAAFASELRLLADDFTEQIFQLRQELRRAIGLPPLANDRDTLQ